MGLAVVTGLGPRTGTSFVMQKAKEHGLPITGKMFIDGYTVPKHNPQGYWDTDLETITGKHIDNTVIKLWYPTLKELDHSLISCVVVLQRRNKLAQLSSIYKVYKDEYELTKVRMDVLGSFLEQYTKLPKWLQNRNQQTVLSVFTEDLDKEYENILRFLERGLTCQ
jgi:hypothetical protein